MTASVEKEIDLRHYARTLWRRKWYTLIPPAVLVAGAAVTVRFIPPSYRVSSTVVYEGRQRMSGALERYILPTTGSLAGDEERAARLLEMKITSSGFLEGVVRSLGLDDDPDMRARAREILAQSAPGTTIDDVIVARKVAWLRRTISVRGIGPWVYLITVVGGSPKFVYDLSLAINEHLFNTVRQELLSEIKAASDFSNEQMGIYKAKLEESQRQLAAYEARRREGTGAPLAAAIDPRAVADLVAQTDVEIERAAAEADALRSEARAEVGAVPRPVVSETEQIRLLRERLESFERQLAWLLIENPWTAPAVVAQNERIAATRASLGDAYATAVLVVYPNAGRDLRQTLSRIALLEAQRGSLEVRRQSLEERRLAAVAALAAPSGGGAGSARGDEELTWLRQKVETNREIYDSFLAQITSSRITEAVESTQLARGFQIVEPPAWPSRPFAPNTRQILLASLVAGISLGIGLVFFLDYMDHTLKDVTEIERLLDLPILGTIPKIGPVPAPGVDADARRRTLLFTLVGVGILVIVVLFTLKRPA